jgi:glutamine amidotransferase
MKVSLMDYGVGNLHSISKGLERAGARVDIVTDPALLGQAECIVFPGVGAFGAAVGKLMPAIRGIRDAVASGTPVLGICLGMQVLFERSEESEGEGVGVLPGQVARLRADRVPHMGWNDVCHGDDPLFDGVPQNAKFYFANSFICRPTEKIGIAETRYGETFVSAVRKGKVYGVQFHPEKSGTVGLRMLTNFVRAAEDEG